MMAQSYQDVWIDEIEVIGLRRPLNEVALSELMASIQKIGVRNPITLRRDRENEGYVLVAGAHRLESAKRLELLQVPAIIMEGSDDDARMWEIAENLHRAELTALERSEHIAEWVKLAEKPVQSAQVSKGGRGHDGGVSKATRDLGIERTDAIRSIKVASLTEEAKQVARETGLDDNQSILIKAKKSGDEVVFLRTEHARREAEKARKEAEKLNADTSRVIALTDAEQFAEWLMERTDLHELPAIISWLEGTKAKDVISALRRKAA